jgi:hypothetical protein
MKKLMLVLVLTALAVGGIFAQEKYDGSLKNTVFFGPVMAGYERTLFNGFSIGVEAGLNFYGVGTGGYIHISPIFADAFARWYPWKKMFFANLGLGYQGGGISILDEADAAGGFHIKPQVGWKIDIGNAGGWIFETRAGFGMTVGGEAQLITITIPILFGRTF